MTVRHCKDCYAEITSGSRCEPHRIAHNERATARRNELRQAGKCIICRKRAVTVDGVRLGTCKVHREYFRARAALTQQPTTKDQDQ